MQVTVFGASGKVGRLVTRNLLASGHTVVAFVHSKELPISDPRLSYMKGDVHDAVTVERSVQGSQAVVSCLGSWHTQTKDILTSAMQSIIPAMEATRTARIITLTGADALSPDEKPGLLQKTSHFVLGLLAPKILRDGEEHLRLLHASKLEWTCVRSPVMLPFGGKSYGFKNKWPLPGRTIPRQAVAAALVGQLEDTHWLGQAPVIYRH